MGSEMRNANFKLADTRMKLMYRAALPPLKNRAPDALALALALVNEGFSPSARDMNFEADHNAYKDSCKTDPHVNKYNGEFQSRTERVINAISNGELSLHCMREAASCFRDMDQNVADLIVKYKEYVWSTPELSEVVKEYFGNSLETLKFYVELENCLKRASDDQLILQIALLHITPRDGGPSPDKEQYTKIAEKLNNFKKAGTPFTADFFQMFAALCTGHSKMLEILSAKRNQLEERIKSERRELEKKRMELERSESEGKKKMELKRRELEKEEMEWEEKRKTRRKIWNIVFGVTYAALCISGAVGAVVLGAPYLAAVPIVAMAPLLKCIFSSPKDEGTDKSKHQASSGYSSDFDEIMEREREVLQAMQMKNSLELREWKVLKEMEKGSNVALQDLNTIWQLVQRLHNSIDSIMNNVELCLEEENAVQIIAKDIMKKQQKFFNETENLITHVVECCENLGRVRTSVLCEISSVDISST